MSGFEIRTRPDFNFPIVKFQIQTCPEFNSGRVRISITDSRFYPLELSPPPHQNFFDCSGPVIAIFFTFLRTKLSWKRMFIEFLFGTPLHPASSKSSKISHFFCLPSDAKSQFLKILKSWNLAKIFRFLVDFLHVIPKCTK